MQAQTIDFAAIMSRRDLLTGQYAPNSAKGTNVISAAKIRALVTARHPSVNHIVEKLYTVVKPF